MKTIQWKVSICLALFALFWNASCIGVGNSALKGGEIVGAGYKAKVLVSYRPANGTRGGDEYSLVETAKGLAVLAWSPQSQAGVLFRTHWRDHWGDHFSEFIQMGTRQGPGYEFIVPSDRRKNGLLLTYSAGTYEGVRIEGQLRPLPRPAAAYVMTVWVPK